MFYRKDEELFKKHQGIFYITNCKVGIAFLLYKIKILDNPDYFLQ